MNKYFIEGFEWFDKQNGNSYHSVRICLITEKTEELLALIPFGYGYGDAYKQTAYKYLIEKGLVKKEDEFNHALNHERFIFRKKEGCSKKELYKVLEEFNDTIQKAKELI